MGVEPAVRRAATTRASRGAGCAGYRDALAAAGVELSPDAGRAAPATIEGGEAAFLRAWSARPAPHRRAVHERRGRGRRARRPRVASGIRVPEELSIVGFDDLPLTRFTDPPLTTVHQPVRRKGEEAARCCWRRSGAHPAAARTGNRVLETRLVVRRSTAAPSGDRRLEVVAAR